MRSFPWMVALLLIGCRLPDSRTAVEHEREAEHHRAQADRARAAIRIAETTRPMPSANEAISDPGAPAGEIAAGRAAYEIQTAADHEKVAQQLRHEAEILCQRVPPSQWRTCPINLPFTVEKFSSGYRLRPGGSAAAESLRGEIGCAIARSRIDRSEEQSACPLFAPGASVRVVDRIPGGSEGPFIEISGAAPTELERRIELLRKR